MATCEMPVAPLPYNAIVLDIYTWWPSGYIGLRRVRQCSFPESAAQ